MAITEDEVRETAQLARLELSDEELHRMTRELDAILGYMQQLADVNVDGVEPTTHAVPLDLPLRADELGPHLEIIQVFRDAPDWRLDGFFRVPKIIETDE
ncbi:MAG TPA: Asp-tRNA(Asn)/Glu-tRNA(Gln) amidotransferase subunit GatC [Polyangia bacterium]|nr:Asp-tRNA(Asn)/Glu-tRNA(Gln) amidotransferase subunit GatC [Polyangia bacterium]